jgi:hypothetical protein
MQETGRRTFLQSIIIMTATVTSSSLLVPRFANANDDKTSSSSSSPSLVSRDKIAELLHAVPTFTIVDPNGVPFMVVGEDAKVTGYFFTEYQEASRILNVAKTSVDKAIREERNEQRLARRKDVNGSAAAAADDDELLMNPWKNARISTVPLDTAVTLVTKSRAMMKGNNYFQVAPSEQDIADALAITGKKELAEGKVPLFYYETFTTDNNTTSPLYFRKSELQAAFKKEHPGEKLPEKILVTELYSVLAEMVTSQDEELKKIVFVPPRESAKKAEQCKSDTPLLLGQRIIVL